MLISARTNLLAGTTNNNIFTGTFFEILPGDGVLQFAFTSDEPAATSDNIEIDVYCGMDVIATNYNPRTAAAPPIFPDDFLLNCPATAGDRIIAKVRNKAAATRNIWWAVMLDLF